MTLLHIDSAITGDASGTRKLSAAIVVRLGVLSPKLDVVYRDRARDPLPGFSGAALAAFAGGPSDSGSVALDEFMAADTVVIGTPMYNFGVPAQPETWIDHLSKPGVTFERTPQGPRGLLRGKRVIIASARGGFYGSDLPAHTAEHQESYLQAVMRFLGLSDVTVIRADGVRAGPERARAAIDAAPAAIGQLELRVAA